MAKCSICGRPAIYLYRAGNKAYCREHFLQYFDKKVRKTIRKYRMFRGKEHIIVAVSGGKDSLSLLHYLTVNKVPGERISALLIDEGISGYREITIKDFLRVVDELGVDYRIASFREEFGLTLDEMVRIGSEKGLPYLPCSYCGVFRRYLLNKVAREMGGTVLATAHNLDDNIQTYLMNIMRNNWERVARLSPVSGIVTHPKFIRRVKPFYEIREKETTLYAVINNLYPVFTECPYAQLNIRWTLRRQLNQLEENNPGIKNSILNSMLSILPILKEKYSELKLYTCKICGEPSAHEICKACIYRRELEIL